jgi:hypothetical protein
LVGKSLNLTDHPALKAGGGERRDMRHSGWASLDEVVLAAEVLVQSLEVVESSVRIAVEYF